MCQKIMVARPARLDWQLMDDLSGGDISAFEELYDRYHHRSYKVALSVCRDDGRAQDAVQEAFCSIWTSAATYRADRGLVAAWLLTLVRYRAIDLARRDRPHAAWRASADRLEGCVAPGDLAQTTIDRDDAARVHASLSRLPEAQQEAITLAFYGELSHSEIAAHLGLPPGTIKSRMRLGLQKLRADVERPIA